MQITRTVVRCIALTSAVVIAIATFDAAHAASKKRHHPTRHTHTPASSSGGAGSAPPAPTYDPGNYK